MSNNNSGEMPLGQKILESPFLLLALGILTMFVFYTIWGFIEVYNLPQSTLP